jgi:hypothetical protein
MRIIIWGTGQIAEKFYAFFEKLQNIKIAHIIDNDVSKCGKYWNGYKIERPDILLKYNDYDKIILALSQWRTVRDQIINEYKIDDSKIDNIYFIQRHNLIHFYDGKADLSEEEKHYIDFVKSNPLEIFNFPNRERYHDIEVEIQLDESIGMFYAMYKDKKMYLNRKYDTHNKALSYVRGLLKEQDLESPHCYLVDGFDVEGGDVVIDAGVAEGNFALDIIDRVSKIYLVESDTGWIEALKYTFEQYKDKVEIVNAYLGQGREGEITIDEIVKGNKVDFIKMDIEGAELGALKGACDTLKTNNVKLDICTYHNHDDYVNIENHLDKYGYSCVHSKGYMVFDLVEGWQTIMNPKLVRGLIRGRKG